MHWCVGRALCVLVYMREGLILDSMGERNLVCTVVVKQAFVLGGSLVCAGLYKAGLAFSSLWEGESGVLRNVCEEAAVHWYRYDGVQDVLSCIVEVPVCTGGKE